VQKKGANWVILECEPEQAGVDLSLLEYLSQSREEASRHCAEVGEWQVIVVD
jgi:hypothetical protein